MQKATFLKYFSIFGVPVLYALLLHILFGLQDVSSLFSVMSMSFLFFGPLIMGLLTTFLSDEKDNESTAFVLLIPWIPLSIFFVMTILLEIEGWACWIMVFPLFMIAASLGGYIGAHLKKSHNNKTYASIALFIPLLLYPIEKQLDSEPTTYRAYTYIDINAAPERIWREVTQVSTIDEKDDSGWLTRTLGFPRPLYAKLNYEGVGAYREAVFTNGLVFHETVTSYDHQKKMEFTIKAYPHELPSTTLDEHVVVGGEYFDVLNGTYELEKLGQNRYRLHLFSHFVLDTTFNFYAGLWARWIMKDIQHNILRIEKQRAEKSVD